MLLIPPPYFSFFALEEDGIRPFMDDVSPSDIEDFHVRTGRA
jgi:hypothetical protein